MLLPSLVQVAESIYGSVVPLAMFFQDRRKCVNVCRNQSFERSFRCLIVWLEHSHIHSLDALFPSLEMLHSFSGILLQNRLAGRAYVVEVETSLFLKQCDVVTCSSVVTPHSSVLGVSGLRRENYGFRIFSSSCEKLPLQTPSAHLFLLEPGKPGVRLSLTPSV